MPDERDLPENESEDTFDDEKTLPPDDVIHTVYGDNLALDREDGDTEDVPFRLPLYSDIAESENTVDSRDNENKMVTMPVFKEPGVPDPNITLPGTGGLDPNPDYDVQKPGQHGAAPQTVRNQPPVRVNTAQPNGIPSPRPMPQQQQQQNYARYQRPQAQPAVQQRHGQYVPPPPQAKQAPPAHKLPRRRRRRGLFKGNGCLWLIIGLFVTFCGGLTIMTAGAAMIFIPRIEEQWAGQMAQVDDYQSFETTFIYDRHGNLLYELFGEGRRDTVPFSRFPQDLIDATVAIEDDTFFTNIGVDVGATTVAFLQYVGASPDETTPGGSTITQQVVRNVLFDFEKRAERSVQRKLEELMLAVVLTQYKSKDEILGMYLNEIYYGNLAYGAQAASQIFFGKNVEELSLGEAALLAGLPQAPAELDPLDPDPEVQVAVEARWRQVLNEMVEEGYITAQERDTALAMGLNYVSPDISLRAPHFTVYARNEMERILTSIGYTPADITRGGMRVYTTVDQSINRLAQNNAAAQVAQVQAQNISNAAVIVLKPLTGEILAMVGSIDYNNDAIDGRVNVTTALRQPGSTMKPFTYSGAIEMGMTPADVIWDTRTEIGIPGQEMYRPVNYDGGFHGPMAMRRALANSYNIPAVQTLRLTGVEKLLEIMRRFGVTTLSQDASQYGLSLTLGGGEVSLLELTNAYAVFANQGALVESTSILCIIGSNDEIIYQYENSCPEGRVTPQTIDRTALGKQVLDPRIAFLMSDILGDNVARSTEMGTNSALRTDGINSSVKTGTSNDYKDNWTVGYTHNVAIGVWVGNNNGDPMINSSGLSGAAPIWNAVISGIYSSPHMMDSVRVGGQLLPDERIAPAGISQQRICDVTRLTEGSTSCPAQITEWMLDGPAGIPDETGTLHYPQTQQAVNQTQTTGSYLELVSPGVYKTLAFRIDPNIAAGIQIPINAGEKPPPAPRYCRVPIELASTAVTVGAQEMYFIAGPSTSQTDSVEAENYAIAHGLAFLPRIECWQDIFVAQNYGPQVATAVITSPSNGQIVSSNMPIIGTVQFSPDQGKFFRLEIQGGPFSNWTTLGDIHYDTVVNGQLEWLAAEGLPAGSYSLRLGIINHNGGFLQQPYVMSFTKQ